MPVTSALRSTTRRLQHLLAAEGEQLPGERRRPLPRLDDLFHVGAASVLRAEGVDARRST